jgi:hypothetical protein
MKPGLTLDPTDILALVLMAVFTMRRMDVRATEARAFPELPVERFDAWKAKAVRARSISINACFLKFLLNSLWFYGFGSHVIPPVLATGGWLVFLGWIAAMTYAWWRWSSAQTEAERLGIVVGRRLVEVPRAEAEAADPARVP